MPVASALMCRFSEKAAKLAMVGAISANPYEPEITAEAVTWAANFVAYATKQMLARSAFYVNEGSFGKIKAHALTLITKHGGTIDRSTLLKNLNVPLTTFKMLIATLLASDMIESEAVEHGKVMYSIK